MGTDRLGEILDAAYVCLTRHGVRRTTMEDIARQAGMSRSAAYQYVQNKDDAFRRLAERVHARALEAAGQAAGSQDSPAERARGVLAVKFDLMRRLAEVSPHARELLACGPEVCAGFAGELKVLLGGIFAEAGLEDPAEAAEICLALVAGLETVPDGARLLSPAADALIAGLLIGSGPAGGSPPPLRGPRVNPTR